MSTCIPEYFQTVWYEPDENDAFHAGHSLLLRLAGEIDTDIKRTGFDPEEHELELIEFEHVYQPRSEFMLKGFCVFPPKWERFNKIVAYKELSSWKAIVKGSNEKRRQTAGAAIERISEIVHMVRSAENHFELLWLFHWNTVLIKLLETIIRRKTEFNETDLRFMVERILQLGLTDEPLFRTYLLGIIQNYAKKCDLSQKLCSLLIEIREIHPQWRDLRPLREAGEKISKILGEHEILLDNEDVWAQQALDDLSRMETGKKVKWEKILAHARKSQGGKPKESWLLRADELLKALGEQEFEQTITRWLEKALITIYLPDSCQRKMKKLEEIPEHLFRDYVNDKRFRVVNGLSSNFLRDKEKQDDREYKRIFIEALRKKFTCRWRFTQRNSSVLKGLIWFCSLLMREQMMQMFYSIANVCYELDCADVAVSTSAGNACFYVLGQIGSSESIEYLLRLKTKIKNRAAHKAIEQALIRAQRNSNTTGNSNRMK